MLSNASFVPSNVFDEIEEAWAALQGDLAAARRRNGGFSQMDAEIEQLRGRCAELEESVRAEREGAEQLRRQLRSATERVRAGQPEAGAADLNKELERVHADLGAERRSGSTERLGCSCACRCT